MTQSFTSPGNTSFIVPAGVSSIDVVAIGGAGGDCFATASGGRGARISATVPVAPGQQLVVGVAGDGEECGPGVAAGGFGGGGAGGVGVGGPESSGAGGGASVVAPGTLSPDFAQALVVAGGGGGSIDGLVGIDGGDAGFAGNDGTIAGSRGGPGTQAAGGAGGAASSVGSQGSAGSSGTGGAGGNGNGAGPSIGGGGGGGGYFGGGGGGGSDNFQNSGTGGGGSSFVAPAGSNVVGPAPSSDPAAVSITYTPVTTPPVTPAKDPKCAKLRAKLKRQKARLAKAQGTKKSSVISANIADTKRRLRKLACG